MKAIHMRPGVRRSRSSINGRLRIRAAMRDWTGSVVDASLSGLRAQRPESFVLAPGQVCDLEIDFGSGVALRSRAQLVRLGDNEVAFRFMGLGPHTEYELGRALATRGKLKDDVSDYAN
jgi:hypothetical protein